MAILLPCRAFYAAGGHLSPRKRLLTALSREGYTLRGLGVKYSKRRWSRVMASRVSEKPRALLTLHRKCPNCDTDNARERRLPHSIDDWQLKACRACGFVYLENPPGYEAFVEDFAWERTYAEQRKIRRRGRRLHYLISDSLKKLRHVVRSGRPREMGLIQRHVSAGRVLDIGCAGGMSLSRLSDRHTPFGIEISKTLAEQAQAVCAARNGAVVRDNAIDGLAQFDADFFDGILMISFLEHEIQPRRLLVEARRVLKPDGAMIIKVPNYSSFNRRVRGARWCGYRYPDHVNYFTPTTFRRMLEDCGLGLRRFRWNDRIPVSDNMWAIAGKAAIPMSRRDTIVPQPT